VTIINIFAKPFRLKGKTRTLKCNKKMQKEYSNEFHDLDVSEELKKT